MPRPESEGEVQQGFVAAQLRKVGDSIEGKFRAVSAGLDQGQSYFVVDDANVWHRLPAYQDLSNQLWRLAAEAKRGKFVNQYWVRIQLTAIDDKARVFTVTKWPYDSQKAT